MVNPLLEVRNLKKYFEVKGRGTLHAVDDISFFINKGDTLGLVGESGCGKSTVGNLLVGLLQATSGEILYSGKNIFDLDKHERKELCRKMQIVFQDPYSSLNPQKTIYDILSEPYLVQKISKGDSLEKKIKEVCSQTNLSLELLSKYPHELDGGKRQMIGITRALTLNPELIICDEPVSSLDVSIQAQIINLLMDLQHSIGLTYLFISHDLSVVKHISKRIIVMYLGRIMEISETDEFFNNPLHPYSKALLSAVPSIFKEKNVERIILEGDVPSPINPAPGCRFYKRCWQAIDKCRVEEPILLKYKNLDHSVACHRVDF